MSGDEWGGFSLLDCLDFCVMGLHISLKISIIDFNHIESVHLIMVWMYRTLTVCQVLCVHRHFIPSLSVGQLCAGAEARAQRERGCPKAAQLAQGLIGKPVPTPSLSPHVRAVPSVNCNITQADLLTTTGCRKYSSTAAPRRADRSTPWKDGWYLQKAPTPMARSPAAEKQVSSLPSLPVGPCPAQVVQVLFRMRKKRQGHP